MNPWQEFSRLAKPARVALERAQAAPREQQLAWLRTLLARNAATEFGRTHRFDQIRDLDAYRHAVPIRPYEAFAPWIERIAQGSASVLTADPVVAFEETGGSSTGCKLIPYTEAGLQGFRAAVLPWLSALVEREPRTQLGPAYVVVSPTWRARERLPNGSVVGLPSEASYLGADVAHLLAAVVLPMQAAAAALSIDEWRTATLLELIRTPDLALVSIWSPTFLTELLASLEGEFDRLLAQLHNSGDTDAKRRLARATQHGRVDTSMLWPKLASISTWTDGASAAHAAQLRERFPQAAIDAKGLLATESPVTVRLDAGVGSVPALTSALIEFVDAAGRCHLSDELEVDGSYRVVLTTASGLYRYDLGDVVRCVRREALVPYLEFVGRTGLVSDLVGEKLTDGFVARVLAQCTAPAALVPCASSEPHYEIWLDETPNEAPATLAAQIDRQLRTNPQYALARDLNQLRAPVVKCVPGFALFRQRTMLARGQRPGDVKSSALIVDRSTLPPVDGSLGRNESDLDLSQGPAVSQ
jgi:hypothetical protein